MSECEEQITSVSELCIEENTQGPPPVELVHHIFNTIWQRQYNTYILDIYRRRGENEREKKSLSKSSCLKSFFQMFHAWKV